MAIFNAGNVAAKQARAFLGGVGGFYSLLEALQNPRHPQHEELLEWVGEEYDPEKFCIEAINRIRMEEKKRVARSSG